MAVFSLHIIGANKEINRKTFQEKKTEQCEFALYLIKLLNYSKGLEAWFSWIKLIFQFNPGDPFHFQSISSPKAISSNSTIPYRL